MRGSKQDYATIPSAFISDLGLVEVPLWGVTEITLNEKYHLPPIGASKMKSVVGTHDDTITLKGMLLGLERHAWKLALENAAETSKRGSALGAYTGGVVGGLILVTTMTIRTDMHIESLVFSATGAKRDALAVTVTMTHMPLPSSFGKLLDVASFGVGLLADFGENKSRP